MSKINRVRYAPSPTGLQHIGGIRTALFNYLFAKSSKGNIFLRIEDTDRERFNIESLNDIYESLKWLGLDINESPKYPGEVGPYIQSERLTIYHNFLKEMIEKDLVYPCFCNKNISDEYSKYDRKCRDIDKNESLNNLKHNNHVWRLKMPKSGKIIVKDLLLGDVSFDYENVTVDPILIKSDGYPTYHFAHVIDDHLMGTTHVLRGQEWLSSSPIHVTMFQSLNWDSPVYCHLPIILGSDGKKLSKRHGSTSLLQFRKEGYIPEAIINYISLLGWAYDDKKSIFTIEELEKLFDLKKLSKGNATFDYNKLNYYNGYWIRQLSDKDLCLRLMPFFLEIDSNLESSYLEKMIPSIKDRLVKLTDATKLLDFMFFEPEYHDKNLFIPKNGSIENSIQNIDIFINELCSDSISEESIRIYCKNNNIKFGDFVTPIRAAFTGKQHSPPIFQLISIIGWLTLKNRMIKAREFLMT